MAREFRERVYKKSFILTTLLTPVLMLALMAAPTLVMMYGKGETKTIEVIDESGIIAPRLESNETVRFVDSNEPLAEALKHSLDNDDFGVLHIGKNIVEDCNAVQLYTNSSSSVMVEETIAGKIADIIEQERLKEYNIENLQEILDKVKANVHLATFRNDKGDEEATNEASSSAAASMVGVVLGFILYMFLLLYGSIVMQSIIEEKNSRILEVMVSTVRPFDMMMGKILGVAMVGATQIAIWGVLMVVMSSVAIPMMMPADMVAGIEAMQAGGADAAAIAQSSGFDPEMLTAMSSMMNVGYIGMIFGTLLLFMVGGFLLYSAMFAAVGASVDSPQDAQQLTTPITIPIVLGLIVMMLVLNDPNSPVAFWCSLIPFTSPIVMMARIPSGIPTWEIVLSLVLLYATFAFMVWVAGKIYRIGIFMHGKKPTFKELWQWLKY